MKGKLSYCAIATSQVFFDKLFKLENKKKEKMAKAVELARTEDAEQYEEQMQEYQKNYHAWQTNVRLGQQLMDKNPKAYLEILEAHNPFSTIKFLKPGIRFSINEHGCLIADISVHSEDIIPKEKYSLRQSGSLSAKQMSKSEFYTLYQDHICSYILRVASELFALLPTEQILINARDNLLNHQNGHMEEQIIISALIVKQTFDKLNLACIDPSDAMNNFLHNKKFKKTTGFAPVEQLTPKH